MDQSKENERIMVFMKHASVPNQKYVRQTKSIMKEDMDWTNVIIDCILVMKISMTRTPYNGGSFTVNKKKSVS